MQKNEARPEKPPVRLPPIPPTPPFVRPVPPSEVIPMQPRPIVLPPTVEKRNE